MKFGVLGSMSLFTAVLQAGAKVLMLARRHHFVLVCLLLLLSRAVGSAALPVTVDPPATLTNYWGFEWNTDADFEGWTMSQASNTVVVGGAFAGVASGIDAQLIRANFTNGPDLDLAYNDWLELRVQVPVSYIGDIQIFYGTTNTTGFSAARVLTIPTAVIPKDGAFHTYRLDLALEQLWRGGLRDLRIDPVGGAGSGGQAFAVDFIRIGDLPGDIYYANTIDQAVTTNELSSKHFRFIWDLNRATNSGMNAAWAHGNLRNAEEVWAIYTKFLGYREPSISTSPTYQDGKKYKVNFLCTFDGYWMGGSPRSFGYLNIDPSGLQVNPPTWVTPHELMHVFQMHNNGGNMPGEWWEGHANYGRERWLHFYDQLFPNNSNIDAGAIQNSHLMIAHGRDYYLTWPLFLYLDENPDALPDLGEGFVARVWQTNASGVYPYATIDQLTTNSSVKDIVGYFARRMVTFDFSHQSAISNALAAQNPTVWKRFQLSELVRRSDDTNWWRVPYEMSPMQGAYAIHELTPPGGNSNRTVTVNFHGLPDAARGADWRATFVVLATNGVERYTPLWNSGSNSVTLAASEARLFLVVAATPDVFIYGGQDDVDYPYRSHLSKQRFPYEVQVFGATPKESNNGGTSGLVQHANGGGWKAATATVDATAFLGPNARVLDTAKVRGTSRVEDYAVVRGNAVVTNSAVVSGHALVWENSVVKDNAKVRDWAIISGGAVVSGNGRALEHAQVTGGVLTDFATAKGCAIMWDNGSNDVVGGWGVVDGDYMVGRTVTNGFAFGHLPYVGVPDDWVRTAPERFFAGWEFSTANDSMTRDLIGVTDGYVLGNPAWTSNDLHHLGTLAFNGANQFVSLDKSACDRKDFSLAAWVKWGGGAANQPVWFFGSATNRAMFLTPDDGAGRIKFSIRTNVAEQSLVSSSAMPTGVWTHIVVTLTNTTGRLYVNGVLAASNLITIRPEQLFAGNSNTAPQHHYLARGADAAQPFFTGALDSVRLYTKALSGVEISNLFAPPLVAGTLYVDLRASAFGAGTATWTNLGALGNFTRVGTPAVSNNVAGTGVPGVFFNGSSGAYQGPNSVADIEGGSDRSIEVWAYNPSLVAEETMVSWGHRGFVRQDLAFNFGSHANWGAATHWGDDVGWGTSPTANAWHHLVYTYAANVVKVYVDGALWNTQTLGGPLDTFTNEPINLACQRDTANGTRSLWFSGYLNTVRVHGGVLNDDQILASYANGPALLNQAPTLAAISNRTLIAGQTLVITNVASDSDYPAQTLTWLLLTNPPGATLSTNGILSWRPTIAQSPSTNPVSIKVTDNGAPSLRATQNFSVIVTRPGSPQITGLTTTNGSFGFQINGDVGLDYIVWKSTNLVNWQVVATNAQAAPPLYWSDPFFTTNMAAFYQIQLAP